MRSRYLLVVAVLASIASAATWPSAAQADPVADARAAVARAERDVAAAQTAANAAAAEYQRTLSEQARVEAAIDATEQSIRGFAKRYEALRRATSERAVAAYKRGGSLPTLAFESENAMDSMRRTTLVGNATDRDRDLMERANAAREDLEARRSELDAQREQQAQLVARARSQVGQVTSRLQSARATQQKLADELRRAEAAAAAELARVATSRRAAAVPARSVAPRGLPVPASTVVDGLVCPVAGPRAFSNDWMAARPGGSRHEGTDIFSPRGTPNVAVIGGTITQKYGSRQGNGVHLNGDDGTLYYYFHLDSYAGGPRRVTQGEVIGYTGDTGSTGAVHTHFEIHPGHGGAVNPYPTLQRIC
ncbi:MAG: hypothetical protein FJW88_11675 [Actinobacteria bacterium]|nr:hypothetical protein [Actinomycetota bacterium]